MDKSRVNKYLNSIGYIYRIDEYMVAKVFEMPLSEYRKLVLQVIRDMIADGTLEVDSKTGIIDLKGE